MCSAYAVDNVFIYSSAATLRGINLTLNAESLLTTSPYTSNVNAMAANVEQGLVYYGSGSRIYFWDPTQGTGAGSHVLINDFNSGGVQAPIHNINSTAGSFLNGKYYVGSETNSGFIEELYEITMSANGRQVSSVQSLGLLAACGCTGVQLGGFGDVAAIIENGATIIYGSTADISGSNSGTSSGRWKYNLTNSSWAWLASGGGGQLSNSPSGLVYTNVGNSIRLFNTVTGTAGNTSLYNTTAAIWDFTNGFYYDFGDATDSYGAAMHRVPASLPVSVYLGQLPPDNEPYSLNAAINGSDGSGDDVTGVDDEDAVVNLVAMDVTDTQYSVSVRCSVGAHIAAWFDLNRNGTFDPNERNSNYPTTCSGGQNSLNWNNATAASAGLTYLRIRVSTDAASIATPTGLSPDGEVEDHPITLSQTVAGNCPAGSASNTYSAADLPMSIGPNANAITNSVISVPDVRDEHRR